ncbi:hypothetical protein EPN52_00845 [bacterium]|nr:MAG: hypothetical protein EPN52_00845 [bacterium]
MNKHSNRCMWACAALVFAAATWLGGPAEARPSPPPTTLRGVMVELQDVYLRLAQALFYDDYASMERLAKEVEAHPMPPGLVVAIKARLGSRFPGFERADEETHAAAAELARRAAAKDPAGSAKALGRLAQSCVACHAQYRPALRALADRSY